MKGFSVDRKVNKNIIYRTIKGKGKKVFSGIVKTKFENYLTGFDILGNKGFALIPDSKIENGIYEVYIDLEPKVINNEQYDKIIKFFLLDKSKQMRKPFRDILNGEIDIEEYSHKMGKEEFLYWKFLFREAYHYCSLIPTDLYPFLKENQPAFDLQKTETQLSHHSYTEKPITNSKLKELFPDHFISGEKEEKSRTKTKKKEKTKKREKILTPERIQECEDWLNLPEREKYKFIEDIIQFYIVGESSIQQTLTIFFLKLGDFFSRELISKVDFHGDPSAGKSYICDVIVSLFPEENYISLFDASPKALLYDSSFDENVKFIFLKELTKGNTGMVELLKALFDGDVSYIATNYEIKDVEKFVKGRTGLLTTYSFEFTQRDAIDRAWVFTPDQSHKQNKLVKNYRLARRTHRIEFDYEEKKIIEKKEFIKDVIRVLRDKPNVSVQIPYLELIEPLFPSEQLRIRRDIDKLPDLIESITRFNQNNRKAIQFNGYKYIFSDYEDLRFALDIALERFIEISQNIDDIQKDILEFMEFTETRTVRSKIDYYGRGEQETFEEIEKKYFLREIYEEITRGKSIHINTIRNKLEGLGANNYIEIIKEGKGKPIKYKLIKKYESPHFPIENYKEDIIDKIEQALIFWENKNLEIIEKGDKIND